MSIAEELSEIAASGSLASGPAEKKAEPTHVPGGKAIQVRGAVNGSDGEGSQGARKAGRGKAARRAQGGDRQAGRARGSDPVLDHELEAMAGQVRDTIDGLSSLLSDALERKLRLGELLTEAKGRCKPRRGAWTVFLSSCGLNERTAREAIQFVRERATVDAQRHGRAGLTVSEVRIALAKPRKAPLDEQGTDNAEQAEQASLPPPGVVAQLCESVTEPEREPHQGDSASREPATREVDDDVRGETEAGGDPGPDDVERLVDACRRLVEVGDGAIAVLGSAPSAANVASLLELLPLARERLRRVDDALAGILGSG